MAVITSPAVKAAPVTDHALDVIVVVVPQTIPFLYTVTFDPVASVLVPLTVVADVHIGELTVGVADVD